MFDFQLKIFIKYKKKFKKYLLPATFHNYQKKLKSCLSKIYNITFINPLIYLKLLSLNRIL